MPDPPSSSAAPPTRSSVRRRSSSSSRRRCSTHGWSCASRNGAAVDVERVVAGAAHLGPVGGVEGGLGALEVGVRRPRRRSRRPRAAPATARAGPRACPAPSAARILDSSAVSDVVGARRARRVGHSSSISSSRETGRRAVPGQVGDDEPGLAAAQARSRGRRSRRASRPHRRIDRVSAGSAADDPVIDARLRERRPRGDVVGGGAPRRPRDPDRRGRREPGPLRRGAHPGRDRFRLADRSPGPGQARLPEAADAFSELFGSHGISSDHTILLYGDRNNWFAAYTYWYLNYYGHRNVKLINGPREKWIAEARPTTAELPVAPAGRLPCRARRRPDPRQAPRGARRARRRGQARRRALAAGVQRRADRDAGLRVRGRAARRPHPGRRVDPVVARGARGRHVQVGGRPAALYAARARRRPRSSPTAGSASARRTPGSCCTSCSAAATSRTTTARGPSGATWSTSRSRRAEQHGVVHRRPRRVPEREARHDRLAAEQRERRLDAQRQRPLVRVHQAHDLLHMGMIGSAGAARHRPAGGDRGRASGRGRSSC